MVQSGAEIVDDVMRSICWRNCLGSYQYNIKYLSEKHAPQCAQFKKSQGRVSQVETIGSEHPEENRQQQRRFKWVSIPVKTKRILSNQATNSIPGEFKSCNWRPQAGDLFHKSIVPALQASYVFCSRARYGRRIVLGTPLGLLRQRINIGRRAQILAHFQTGTVRFVHFEWRLSSDITEETDEHENQRKTKTPV